MPAITGNNGAISVNGKAIAQVRNFTIDIKADTIETSIMGTDVRTYVKGLSSYSGSADIYFDSSEFDTDESTFNPTSGLVGAAAVSGKFFLDYSASSNDTVFQGDLIITGYSVKSSMDGLVEATVSFQGSGATTFSTGTSVTYP